MKQLVLSLLLLSSTSLLFAQRINEIHYDNTSADVGEFIEVFIPDAQPTDITNYTLELYNGGNGMVYKTLLFDTDATTFSSLDATGVMGVFYLFSMSTNGLQNGSPDGIALIDATGTVLEFLSYEGVMTATNGAASGTTSVDIGASESGSTMVGSSLEYNANTGMWEERMDDSPGAMNGIISCDDGIQNGDETGIDCGGSCSNTCGAGAYYDGIKSMLYNGMECGMLKTELYNLIKDHTVIPYNSNTSYDARAFFCDYDMRLNDTGTNTIIWDTYSDNPAGIEAYEYLCDEFSSNSGIEGNGYHREHVFPVSWWGSSSSVDQYKDLHNLLPSDSHVNLKKSNFTLGETSIPTFTSTNGTKVGAPDNACGGANVFEPIDEYKGDFARIFFYMATRYEDIIASWESLSTTGDLSLDGSSDIVYESCLLQTLLTWHENDPVSDKEYLRNNAIFNIQGNRNPFVDAPEFVTYIWGGTDGSSCSDNSPLFIAPKVYLQGPFNGTEMNANLNTANLIPINEPYTALGFAGIQNAGTGFAVSYVPATGGNAMEDWVITELRDAINPAIVVASRATILQRDGDVVDIDGVSPVGFIGVAPGSYYVAIRHLNHLGVMTETPMSF